MNKRYRFLIVEDQELAAEVIRYAIKSNFSRAEITTLRTEKEFRDDFENIARKPPTVIILDVMLRWTVATKSMQKPPDDVRKGGYYRAGLRCHKILRSDDRTKRTPVVLYSIIGSLGCELQQLPETTIHVQKDQQSPSNALIAAIQHLLS